MEMKMTSVNFTHTNPSLLSLLGHMFSPLGLVRRYRERQELLGLLDQPDHILKDIGLQRDEISREALKRVWTL
jgi:uncharacterized protein YjiS (DUF1127 family)